MGVKIGILTISWYGLFIVSGIAAGAFLGFILMRVNHLQFDDFIQIACFVGLGAMAGAKGLYLGVSWNSIDFTRITDSDYLSLLMGGGFVFYGGLFGGMIGLYLCGKILHICVSEYACNAIPVIPLAHAFGRMGCAFVGCCYGIPYDGPGAIVYKESIAAPMNVPLFPVQVVEAAGELLIAGGLCAYIAYCHKRKREIKSIELYLLLYGALRFVLEFLRYDDSERGMLCGISTSQWISVIIIVMVFGVEIWKWNKRRHSGQIIQ